MIMSASPVPARSSTSGLDAWPTTPWASRLSLIRRISSGEVSMTVTSLPSRASCRAMLKPTWPAPQMMIRMS